MKKLIVLILIGVFAAVANAQDTKADKKSEVAMNHECYMMKEGTVMHCTGDKAEPIKSDVTLKGGIAITTKGEVRYADGNTAKLENGQCVSLMGGIGDCDKMHAKESE